MTSLLAAQLLKRTKNAAVLSNKQRNDIDSHDSLLHAQNALDALAAQDPRFTSFSSSILSNQLMDSEIELLAPEHAAQIKTSISQFLVLLSPHILSRPGTIMLNWLISKWRINRFLPRELVMAVLPHHESKQFVAIVRKVEIEDWAWITMIKAPLARTSIVTRCLGDLSLIKAIVDSMNLCIKERVDNKALLSFFTASIAQLFSAFGRLTVVRKEDKITSILGMVLPVLVKMMRLKKEKDMQSAAMILFSQLVYANPPQDASIVPDIVSAIVMNVAPALEYLALQTLVAISQQGFTINSVLAVKVVVDFKGLSKNLKRISDSYVVEPFLDPFLLALIENGELANEGYDFITRVVQLGIPASGDVLKQVCYSLITRFGGMDKPVCAEYLAVVRSFENFKSELLSTCIQSVIENTADAKNRQAIYDFVDACSFNNTGLIQIDTKNDGVLGLTLVHTDEAVRFLALERLAEILSEGGKDVVDKEFLAGIISRELGEGSIRCRLVILERMDIFSLFSHDVLAIETILRDLVMSGEEGICTLALKIFAEKGSKDTLAPLLFASLTNSGALPNALGFAADIGMVSASTGGDMVSIVKELAKKMSMESLSKYIETSVGSIGSLALALATVTEMLDSVPGAAEWIVSFIETRVVPSRFVIADEGMDFDAVVKSGVDSLAPRALSAVLVKLGEKIDWMNSGDNVDAKIAERVFNLVCGSTELMRVFFSTVAKKNVLEFAAYKICREVVTSGKGMIGGGLYTGSSMDRVDANLLLICAEFIKKSAAKKNKKGVADFQLFLPVLLTAFQREGKVVRKSGLECIAAIVGCYGDAKKSFVFGQGLFYGKGSDKIQILKASVALKLATALYDRRKEIQSDTFGIQTTIETLLGDKSEKDWKKASLQFICSCVIATPFDAHKNGILEVVENVDSGVKLVSLFPLVESVVKSGGEGEVMVQLVKVFCMSSAKETLEAGKSYFKMFLKLLADDTLGGKVQKSMVGSITPSWFSSLSTKKQLQIFSVLVKKRSPTAAGATKKTLSALSIDSTILVFLLDEHRKALVELESVKGGKRHKGDTALSVERVASIDSLVFLLELSSSGAVGISEKHLLVPVLFDLLGAVVSHPHGQQFSVGVEYCKQLLLSFLLTLVTSCLESEIVLNESLLHVDYIVQCIRGTDNPQTHNASLILMAAIAGMHPDSVLANIMPVFTFMGANVLRQDDNYSFHVIKLTLETILPALLIKQKTDSEDMEDSEIMLHLSVKPILQVFIDALFHIPKHRRMGLFTILVSVLGEMEFLQPVISLLVSKAIGAGVYGPATAINKGVLEFASGISNHFSIESQLKMLYGILSLVRDTPTGVEETVEGTLLFLPSEFSQAQLYNMKVAHLDCFVKILTSKIFMDKIGAFGDEEMLEIHHVRLVECLFTLLSRTRQEQAVFKTAGNDAGLVYADEMVLRLYECLDKVHGFLSLDVFIKVIGKLCENTDENVVLKSVALLNQKISESGNIESATLELLSGLVPTLIGIAGSNMASATREAAFLCIAALVRKVGKRDVDVYIKALPVSTACIEDSDRDLASSAIACLSCLVHVFGARCITHLPKFMPSVLRIISNFLAGDEASSGKSTLNFVYAALSCVSVIVNSIPKFISPYIPTILSFSLAPFFLSKKNHGSRLHQQISESNLALCVALTDKVPCRIILPAIFNHLKPAMKVGGVDSTIMLYRMLSKSVEKMSGTELLENYSGIFRFYLYGFDFKGERVEEELTESFLNFVGKLNDTMFRSLFLKMVEWGTATVEEGEEERVGLFYRILTALLDKLKSMFAPYCGYVLDGALGHLMQFAEGGEKAVDIKVWGDILVFMKKFFSYENEGMINAEKFARVYPVLLSQIDTDVIEGDEFVEIVKKYLVPVLGQLAVNVSSDDLWKKLNFAVLMKTRDDDPRIRLACLWVELELWKVLGEDFLVFLEESIPFLAELREDVDEDVDALCGKVLVGIEGLLGSSLDTYFEK